MANADQRRGTPGDDRIAALRDMEIAPDFVRRVAARNGWSIERAVAADREYRRFLFLSTMTDDTIVPPLDVDMVWHEHILHTRHYTGELPRILGRTFHHDPGSPDGGDADAHRRGYGDTLELYRRTFGETPPPSVWPDRAAAPAIAGAVASSPFWVGVASLAILLLVALRMPFNLIASGGVLLIAASFSTSGTIAERRLERAREKARTRVGGAKSRYKGGRGHAADGSNQTDDGGGSIAAVVATAATCNDGGGNACTDSSCSGSSCGGGGD